MPTFTLSIILLKGRAWYVEQCFAILDEVSPINDAYRELSMLGSRNRNEHPLKRISLWYCVQTSPNLPVQLLLYVFNWNFKQQQ